MWQHDFYDVAVLELALQVIERSKGSLKHIEKVYYQLPRRVKLMSSVGPLILENLSLVKSYALRLTIAQGIFKDLATSPKSVADVSASLGGHKLGNLIIDYLSELGYLNVEHGVVNLTDEDLRTARISPSVSMEEVQNELTLYAATYQYSTLC